ncbi:hypothetical protein N2152v2_010255 [Parachlorella kessleri]
MSASLEQLDDLLGVSQRLSVLGIDAAIINQEQASSLLGLASDTINLNDSEVARANGPTRQQRQQSCFPAAQWELPRAAYNSSDVVQLAHQGLIQLIRHTNERAGSFAGAILRDGTAVLNSAAELVSFLLATTRGGCGTVDEAVYHLCRLSLWVLDGSSATLVSALQRQLAGAAELFLADEPVVDVLLPMVALMLLRQPNMVRALARGTSTFQSAAAAAALAALPSLLRRYLSCGPRDGLADVLEGITAVAWHCHQLMIAHMAGPHAACSLPRAAWEGTASCFAALQGVLERGIPSLAMPAEDGVAELLATAMGMVEGLLPLLSYFVSAHGATTIDPADADAVASHGADQLRALVGSLAVHKLGVAAECAVILGPQAVAATLRRQPDSQHPAFDSLGYLVASLSKLAIRQKPCTQGGCQPTEIAKAVRQLHTCVTPFFTAVGPDKKYSQRSSDS